MGTQQSGDHSVMTHCVLERDWEVFSRQVIAFFHDFTTSVWFVWNGNLIWGLGLRSTGKLRAGQEHIKMWCARIPTTDPEGLPEQPFVSRWHIMQPVYRRPIMAWDTAVAGFDCLRKCKALNVSSVGSMTKRILTPDFTCNEGQLEDNSVAWQHSPMHLLELPKTHSKLVSLILCAAHNQKETTTTIKKCIPNWAMCLLLPDCSETTENSWGTLNRMLAYDVWRGFLQALWSCIEASKILFFLYCTDIQNTFFPPRWMTQEYM